MAVRLSFEEESTIREAAQRSGMTVSAFMRQAGLAAASSVAIDLERLRREVRVARVHIDDAWRSLACVLRAVDGTSVLGASSLCQPSD